MGVQGENCIIVLCTFLLYFGCFAGQTALDVPWAGKCAGENNGSTIDSIVLAKVARGRSSPRTTKNADWFAGLRLGRRPGPYDPTKQRKLRVVSVG